MSPHLFYCLLSVLSQIKQWLWTHEAGHVGTCFLRNKMSKVRETEKNWRQSEEDLPIPHNTQKRHYLNLTDCIFQGGHQEEEKKRFNPFTIIIMQDRTRHMTEKMRGTVALHLLLNFYQLWPMKASQRGFWFVVLNGVKTCCEVIDQEANSWTGFDLLLQRWCKLK